MGGGVARSIGGVGGGVARSIGGLGGGVEAADGRRDDGDRELRGPKLWLVMVVLSSG